MLAQGVNIMPQPLKAAIWGGPEPYYRLWTWFSTVSAWLIVAITLSLWVYFKSFPLIWHLRLANGLRYVLRSQRIKVPNAPSSIFRPIITTSNSPVSELDMNMHKSNSTYLSDLDIARTHLVSTLFSTGIERARFAASDATIGGGDSQLFVMLASLSCSFHRQINPYEGYEMWTRVLSWDKKWLYILTHFVSPPGKGEAAKRKEDAASEEKSLSGRKIYASALSKCVFKKGRLSVSPEAMLHLSGMLDAPDTLEDTTQGKLGTKEDPLPSPAHGKAGLHVHTREELEGERLRGLELASKLAELEKLHGEFEWDAPPLAKRDDGHFVLMMAKVFIAAGSYYFERIKMMLGK